MLQPDEVIMLWVPAAWLLHGTLPVAPMHCHHLTHHPPPSVPSNDPHCSSPPPIYPLFLPTPAFLPTPQVHQAQMEALKQDIEDHRGKGLGLWPEEPQLRAMTFLVHFADVSNPAKEWPVGSKWGGLVCTGERLMHWCAIMFAGGHSSVDGCTAPSWGGLAWGLEEHAHPSLTLIRPMALPRIVLSCTGNLLALVHRSWSSPFHPPPSPILPALFRVRKGG